MANRWCEMTREECGKNASTFFGEVMSSVGSGDGDWQVRVATVSAIFAIAEALHAVADALKPGEGK